MGLSLACQDGAHDGCLRPSCGCACGHPRRLTAEERAAAPRNVVVRHPEPASRPARVRKPSPSRPRRPRAPRPSGPRLDPPVAEIAAAYLAGARMRDLAQRYGVGQGTIRDRLVRGGVTIRPKRLIVLPDAEIAARYEAGATAAALAHEFGVAESTIANHLRSFGVQLRHAVAVPPDEYRKVRRRQDDRRRARVHHDQGEHGCDLCPSRFSTRIGLAAHRRGHTQPLLTCPECGDTLRGPAALGSHRRALHGVISGRAA